MLNLTHLDERTRGYMLEEVSRDVENGSLYLSERLTPRGRQEYPELLRVAVRLHDDEWLAGQLRRSGLIEVFESRRKPSGGYTQARVPVTAAQTLAEGEFNRFYARGLCLRAIADGVPALLVYRAKEVSQPRAESVRLLGNTVEPQALLDDLQSHQGIDTALRVPPGPNSGLSVRLPDAA